MRVLRRLLGIRPGEGRLAGAVGAVMVATAAGAAMGAAATEALLFANFDLARLPLLYVALGATTFVCALVASGFLAGADRQQVYVALPVALAATVLAERVAVATRIEWTYAVAWLAMNVVTTLQGIVSWGIAAAVCDTRQAKRLFPLFNAGRIAGAVAGSVGVALAVPAVAVVDLLFVWVAALAVAAAVAFALRDRVQPAGAQERAGLLAEMRRGLRIVRASQLLRLLAVSLVLFSVLYFALALPFSRGARAEFSDEARLASFLGVFNASTTIVALVASLFVANRLYARIGIVNAIVSFAGVYLAGFLALLASGAFAVLVAARFAQTVWLTGIADTAYQALFNPVPPERRDQIRAFMEGVPGQAGIALAGLLLLAGDVIDPRAIAVVGMLTSLATVLLLLRARTAYGRALVEALRSGRPQPFVPEADPFGALRHDRHALAVTLAGLADTDPAVRRVSAEILRQVAVPSTVDALVAALDDPDEEVRRSTVAALARIGVIGPIERFASDPNARVRARVALATGRGIDALLADSDPDVRVAALDALAERADPASAALAVPLTRDELASVRRAAVAAIASAPGSAADALVPLLGDGDPPVAAAALDALVGTDDTSVRATLAGYGREAVSAAAPECLALRALGVAQDERRALLADALRSRAAPYAERGVRVALALAGRDRADLVLESLASTDRSRRASAVELLEAIEQPDLVRPLLPLWEEALDERDGPAAPLVEHADAFVRACAVLASAPELPSATLERLAIHDPDATVRETARRAMTGGPEMETLPTISLMERVLFLRKVPLFADLPPADLKQIAGLAHEELGADGSIITREGDVGDRLFVITSGTIRVIAGVGARVLARRAAGDFVGEMSIITDQPRRATLVCEGETRLLVIARRDFEVMIRDRPSIATAIMRVLCARLLELQAAVV